MTTEALETLITLSRNLGDPVNDYVILGEGNTSTLINDDIFWVKASGTELRTIEASGFVKVTVQSPYAVHHGYVSVTGHAETI